MPSQVPGHNVDTLTASKIESSAGTSRMPVPDSPLQLHFGPGGDFPLKSTCKFTAR